MLPDVTLHIPAMRRYALVLTRSTDRAEDLVQDSLARALAGAGTWQPDTSLRTWLLAIVHHTFVSGWRRDQAERRALRDAALDAAGNNEPARQAELVEAREVLEALLALPDGMREVLLLASVEGLSYREIADMHQVPLGTIMSRLARARAALRAHLQGESGSAEPRAALKVVR